MEFDFNQSFSISKIRQSDSLLTAVPIFILNYFYISDGSNQGLAHPHPDDHTHTSHNPDITWINPVYRENI